MAKFRIETVLDPVSGLYFNEVYYPDNAEAASVSTKPIYKSFAEAEAGAIEAFKRAFPSQPVSKSGE